MAQVISPESLALLAPSDVRNLTLFKWRYSLESQGFTTPEASALLFLKWRMAQKGAKP